MWRTVRFSPVRWRWPAGKMKALGDAALNVAVGSDGMLNVEASAAVGDREYASSSLVYAIAPVNQPEVEAPTVGDDPEG
ncbi:hypothetical protein [Hyphomonas sp.]|uniref:hypothetical protein n=1 Tax=Hyphomonas sp. TaxID=87 RepID=UPI0025C5DC03|nr:hypothetical protein [Hyphomonas sp.]